MPDVKITTDTRGVNQAAFKEYSIDPATGITTVESWTPPSRQHGMKQVLDRVKRGADGAGIHFSYSVDPEDIVTYTEAEYKKLADSQKEDLIFDPTTKLWWRMESAVFLEFGDFQGKGWKVMARLEPMNNTTEKDRVWRALKVLPFPGVTDSEIYPHLPATANDCSRCDACGNLRYRVDTYLLRSPKGKYEIVGTTCMKGYTGLDPELLLQLYTALDPKARSMGGKNPSPRNLKVANKNLTKFLLLVAQWDKVHGYTKYAPGVTAPTRRYYSFKGQTLGDFLFTGYYLDKGMTTTVSGATQNFMTSNKSKFDAVGKQFKDLGNGSYEMKGPLFVSNSNIPYLVASPNDKDVQKLHSEMMLYLKNLNPINSYSKSLKSIFETGEVTRKISGLAASTYTALQNFKNPPPPKPTPAPKPKGQYSYTPKAPTSSNHPDHIGSIGQVMVVTVVVDSNRNMTSRAGKNFNLMKASTLQSKKITMFASPGTPLANSNAGSTITVEGIVKEHSMYKGVRSTVLSNARIVPSGTTTSTTYIGNPGDLISETVTIDGVKPATYGGQQIDMTNSSGKKLVAYDQYSNLQNANVGEKWEFDAKVKRHSRGKTQVFYIKNAKKV